MGEFNDEYLGVIEHVDLDSANGRCKVRVFGVFGHYDSSKNKIPTGNLPWAYPKLSAQFSSANGSGQLSIPKINVKVNVVFENGDHMHPRYTFIEEVDPVVIDKAKQEGADGFHSFLWDSDSDLKMYFSKGSGLILDYSGSYINIKPDGTILLDHKESQSTIEMQGGTITIVSNAEINQSAANTITQNSRRVHVNGEQSYVGHNPVYRAPLGEYVFKAFEILAAGIDKKYPATPGAFSQMMRDLKEKMLSDTVKVSK